MLEMTQSESQALAERFAPVVIHAADEPNLPANVDWFLGRTSLYFYDRNCNPPLQQKMIDHPSQADLTGQTHPASCGFDNPVNSGGTRSASKWRTFFLEDVAEADRKGCVDQSEWTTYFHVHPNVIGGVTIQYWRFYAYNSGLRIDLQGILQFLPAIKIGFHGGDWEGIHVVLDDKLSPVMVHLLGHTSIERLDWSSSSLQREDTHLIICSEKGGHASLTDDSKAGFQQSAGLRHNTWEVGTLLNMGEKTAPLNGQMFVQYSGLWGTPSALPKAFPLVPADILQKGFFASSGYWGPAFNETELRADNFVTAWGEGTSEENKVVNATPEYRPTNPVS